MNHIIITEGCGTIRALGRDALRGNWKLALLAMLVFNIAAMVPQLLLTQLFPNAPFISTLYTVLVTGPLTLGYSIFALSFFRKQNAQVTQIFYGFEQFGKTLGMYLLICLIIFLWMLIAIPGAFFVMLSPLLFPLIFVLFIPAIIAAYRYEQAFFILADRHEIGVMDCVAESKELMRGNKLKLFLLDLSFIGWSLLASLPLMIATGYHISAVQAEIPYGTVTAETVMAYYPSFGLWMPVLMIPLLWVYTYMMATKTAFYEMLCGNLRPGVYATTAEIVENSDAPRIDLEKH